MGLINSLFRQRRSDWSRVTGSRQALLIMAGLMFFALIFMRFDAPVSVPDKLKTATVAVGRSTITVEVADDPAEQARGLSGRRSLSPGKGMLFLFDEPERYGFWMNDMNFPIDIVWIRGGQIVEISALVPAPAAGRPPVTLTPAQPVDMVLEVPAGYAQNQGWRLGLTVSLTSEE